MMMNDQSTDIMLDILEQCKEDGRIPHPKEDHIRFLIANGMGQKKEDGWLISREERIDIAMALMAEGVDAEKVVQHMTWKDFEGLVAGILERNGYRCIESFRRVGDEEIKGMEIDVIGIKGQKILSVDAKMWGIRKGKSSALKLAAEEQFERTKRLCNQLDMISQKIGDLEPGNYELTPVLVTWFVEDIQFHEGVPMVPVFKLNSFVLELVRYHSLIKHLEASFNDG
jgi:hypothetical protein